MSIASFAPDDPKQSIPPTQPASWVLALEFAYLLTQGNKFKFEVVTRSEERAKPTEETQEEPEHRTSLPH
jgi:hypothetical protein